jgi:hypothetical protein
MKISDARLSILRTRRSDASTIHGGCRGDEITLDPLGLAIGPLLSLSVLRKRARTSKRLGILVHQRLVCTNINKRGLRTSGLHDE